MLHFNSCVLAPTLSANTALPSFPPLHHPADQRAFELEDRLMQQLRQTRSFDDNQRLEAEQAMLLHSKNAELQNRVKDVSGRGW